MADIFLVMYTVWFILNGIMRRILSYVGISVTSPLEDRDFKPDWGTSCLFSLCFISNVNRAVFYSQYIIIR